MLAAAAAVAMLVELEVREVLAAAALVDLVMEQQERQTLAAAAALVVMLAGLTPVPLVAQAL